jgi:HSP20 family molecular chaperone IbpA
MTVPQTIRTRWDRILLGAVLALQVLTLVGLIWVVLDRRSREPMEIQYVQSPEHVHIPTSNPGPRTAHRLSGDLFEDMDRAMAAMSQFSDMPSFLQWENQWDGMRASPAMDIRDFGDRCVVYVSMPGVKSDDVDVRLDKGLLSVSASSRIKQGGGERFETFERKVHVPEQVGNPDLVTASLSNGVLQVILPYGNSVTQSTTVASSRRLL